VMNSNTKLDARTIDCIIGWLRGDFLNGIHRKF
jgi:hypothetical protein